MFESLLKSVFGSKHDREVKRVRPAVDEINRHVEAYQALSDEDLRAQTGLFKARLAEALEGLTEPAERRAAEREALAELLPEAFAAVKEACRRLCGRSWNVVALPTTWDMVPYDVQLIGGMVIHVGRVAPQTSSARAS